VRKVGLVSRRVQFRSAIAALKMVLEKKDNLDRPGNSFDIPIAGKPDF
jgi:hypothetical protein